MTAVNGLLEVSASELRPGDRVTFGDHTGWYKVREVRTGLFVPRDGLVLLLLAQNRRWLPGKWSERLVTEDRTSWVRR